MKTKMKKILTILMSLVLILALVACNGADKKPETTDEPADKVWKVAMIANAPIDDGGFNASCYAGMTEAAKIHGFETAYTENVSEADYVAAFTDYANAGFDLIFAPGNEFTDSVEAVAPNFPNVDFMILNGFATGDNYISIRTDNTAQGFVAGVMAGLKTKTNHLGFVGGMEITTGLQAADGFEQGVKYVNPEATVHTMYSNSWDDMALGKEIALSMINTYDVDVFFGAASAVDVGTREAALEQGRWAVAQPGETLEQNPDVILTSVITDNTALIGYAMEQCKAGTLGNDVFAGGVAEGILFHGKIGPQAEDVEEEFLRIFAGIKDGSITFDYNVEE